MGFMKLVYNVYIECIVIKNPQASFVGPNHMKPLAHWTLRLLSGLAHCIKQSKCNENKQKRRVEISNKPKIIDDVITGQC